MAKEKKPSYLSPKRLLSRQEFQEYKQQRQQIETRKLRNRLSELKSENKYVGNKIKYGKTTGGRIGNFLSKGFRTAGSRRGVTNALYRQQGQLPPTNIENRYKTIQGMKTGKRGRPTGTVDKRYAEFGGVYGYRKYQAQQRFLERQRVLQNSAANPAQQQVLRQIQQRQAMERQSPERRIIPDTSGNIFMADIMGDINRATNLVD